MIGHEYFLVLCTALVIKLMSEILSEVAKVGKRGSFNCKGLAVVTTNIDVAIFWCFVTDVDVEICKSAEKLLCCNFQLFKHNNLEQSSIPFRQWADNYRCTSALVQGIID